MKFVFALRVLCVLCGASTFAVSLDREAFTITKYDLAITVEPREQQRLGARGKITLRNESSQPQKITALQISSSLAWRSIRVDGKPLQFVSQSYVSDIDHTGALSEAIVTLPAEVKPRDSVEIEIGYEGVIPLDTTRLIRVGVPEAVARHSSGTRLVRRLRRCAAQDMWRGIRLRLSRRISPRATVCSKLRIGGRRGWWEVNSEPKSLWLA